MPYTSVDPEEDFDDAADWLSTNAGAASFSNAVKLELYGSYKVATVGSDPGAGPGFFSGPAVKAKHSAWVEAAKRFGNDVDAAKSRYIEIAFENGWQPAAERGDTRGGGSGLGGVRVSAMQREAVQEQDHPSSESHLHRAVEDGRLDDVKRLIEQDPTSLNGQDEYGMTPLHVAADRGHEAIARFLLASGADISIQEQDGMTPFALAEISGRSGIMDLLRES